MAHPNLYLMVPVQCTGVRLEHFGILISEMPLLCKSALSELWFDQRQGLALQAVYLGFKGFKLPSKLEQLF